MFKYVLCVTFAVSCASARTMSVSCNGVVTTGVESVSCGHPGDDEFAEVSAGLVFNGIRAFVIAGGHSATATATFADDYVFTITGGAGAGFFIPCMTGSTDDFTVGSSADISFGAVNLFTAATSPRGVTIGSCISMVEGIPMQVTPLPFVFGVPQAFTVTVSARAGPGPGGGSGDSQVELDGFRFLDGSGNQLTNVNFTLVSAPVPEPSSFWLIIAGLLIALVHRTISSATVFRH